MATSREQIRTWLLEGKAKGATHTIIVCDTFDYEDYPVHVMPDQNVREVDKEYRYHKPMQRVMEVYSHKLDHESQLNETRAFNYD